MTLDTIVHISHSLTLQKQLIFLVQKLWIAELTYQSHGKGGECQCSGCLVLRLRISALEEDLLYKPAELTGVSIPGETVMSGILKRYGKQ